jgi:4-diphosphocytidyl-2-C-methyl-D-erythritol kinase
VRKAQATAKVNLALVVGPRRPDGMHEVATVLQRIDLADSISLEPAAGIEITGFPDDTLVRHALLALADAAAVEPQWSVEIEKRIPVGAGLGGGSSDAATALRLANETLVEPLAASRLHAIASGLGADVPFFLTEGPQLGTGDGTELSPLQLPREYVVVLVLPTDEQKASTASVYEAFSGADEFAQRRAALYAALEAGDLAALPPNDLASSPLADELRALGAFRADVSGAGPAVFGLFADRDQAEAARRALHERGRTWLTAPAWYG